MSNESVQPPSDETPAENSKSDAEIRDELPEDLNTAGFVGPYLFHNNNRRKIPA